MLTMRPNFRSIMPSMTDLIRKMGASMLASTAAIHMSRSHSRKSPRGGPPLLFTKISGAGTGCQRRRAAILAGDVAGHRGDLGAGQLTDFRGGLLKCGGGAGGDHQFHAFAGEGDRAGVAEPLLAAQTMAFLPCSPRSMDCSSL